MSHLPGAKRAKHQQLREEHDWYLEDDWASDQLFASLTLQGPMHDPCCGQGRIVTAARAADYKATGTDIVDRGFPGTELVNFLTDDRPRTTLVFNAPYVDNEIIISQALKVATQAVVALARIGFLNGQERDWNLYRPCPPSLILECSERVNCPKDGEGTKESGGAEEYAWLVWSRKKPQWRRCGGIISHGFRRPELGTWWHAPDGTILDWLEPKLRLPQTRSVA